MRSSRGDLAGGFAGSMSTPSASRSSRSDSSDIFCLRGPARKEGHTFGHTLFPCVGRGNRGHTTAFLLEPERALRKFPRLLQCQVHAFSRTYEIGRASCRERVCQYV